LRQAAQDAAAKEAKLRMQKKAQSGSKPSAKNAPKAKAQTQAKLPKNAGAGKAEFDENLTL